MNTRKKALSSVVAPLLALVMVVNLASCGTILHPERQGQRAGQIDPGIAILDGVGLLFFIIPGVIAFAVDISNRTIYLPHGRSSSLEAPHRYAQTQIGQKLDMSAIEAFVRAETGKTISLQQSNVEVVRLDSASELDARFAAYEAGNRIALAQ